MKALFLPFFLLFHFIPTESASFTCNSNSTSKCQGLVSYNIVNSTNISSIQTLFRVKSFSSLLGTNNLPPSTPSSHRFPAGSTIRIPFPCACSKGTGVISSHTLMYTVKQSDTGLDTIARVIFQGLVTYQEIAEFNDINPNVITVGEKLSIPLPCSCDPVEGEVVVHLGHVVAEGSTVAAIAKEFGADADVLMRLNGISDPQLLQVGQVLDVPLEACSSSISRKSSDHNLLLPNGSYTLTAGKCIQCSCSSSTYQLSCQPFQGQNSTTCPVAKCGNMYIGNSTTSGCNRTTCTYQGYKNSTSGLKISSGLITESTCNVGNPAPQPTPSLVPGGNLPLSPNSAGRRRLGLRMYWIELLMLIQIGFFCFRL